MTHFRPPETLSDEAHPPRVEPVSIVRLTVGALLAVDLLAIALHVAGHFLGRAVFWDINNDRGFGEALSFAQFFGLAWMSAALLVRTGEWPWLAWGLLFFVLFADDAFQLHEKVGLALARQLGWATSETSTRFVAGVPLLQVAEHAVTAAYGAFVVGLLAATWRTSPRPMRRTSAQLAGGLALLAIFGVGMDTLAGSSPVVGRPIAHEVVEAIESGGELVCVTLLVGVVLSHVARHGWQSQRPA